MPEFPVQIADQVQADQLATAAQAKAAADAAKASADLAVRAAALVPLAKTTDLAALATASSVAANGAAIDALRATVAAGAVLSPPTRGVPATLRKGWPPNGAGSTISPANNRAFVQQETL